MFKARSPYKVLKQVGEGLNASVYKVSKKQPFLKTNHIFALKVLKNSSDLKVFKLEFETLMKAHGKHLVRYCGWENYKSRPALLLEFIDGVTLYELCKSHKLSLSEVMWIQQESIKGLQELQSCNLAHGDLSLKNIMIQNNGQLKLIDFGLSHWSTQRVELTPEFADPCVLAGEKPSYKTDLVSIEKIIKEISLHLDITRVTQAEEELPSPPQSLLEKIKQTTTISIKTKPISLNKKKTSSLQQLRLTPWLLTSLLFLAPASATNSLKKEALYQIRSKTWLKVSSQYGQTCFTPCELKLKNETLETLIWENSEQQGSFKSYTTSGKIISIEL